MIANLDRVTISTFKGDFDRGIDESVPPNKFINSLNVQFEQDSVRTRDFFSDVNAPSIIGDVVNVYPYTDNNGDNQYVFSTNDTINGRLYAKHSSGVTVIQSSTTVADWAGRFTMVQVGKLLYFNVIMPGVNPIGAFGRGLWVWDVTDTGGTARKAGGAPPTTGLTAATSATAGNVEVGIHLIAFAFEFNTGFISKPSAVTSYTAPGAFSIDLSSVDTGPTGTVKRHILVTKKIGNYSGNPEEYEFFKLTTIENNTATTITINFYDNDLTDSADSLFDLLETVPSCNNITYYSQRLILIGIDGNPNTWRASNKGEVEAFDEVSGIATVNPAVPGGLLDGQEVNGLLYIISAYTIVVASDNDDYVNTWKVDLVDDNYYFPYSSTENNNLIGHVRSSHGGTNSALLLKSKTGLMLFRGAVQDELTWEIKEIWSTWLANLKDIYVDTTSKRIYIRVDDTNPRFLVGDFQDGLDRENIKWTFWRSKGNHEAKGIVIYPAFSSTNSRFGYVSKNGVFFQTNPAETTDNETNGNNIATESFIRLGPVSLKEDWVCQFNMVFLRIYGSGTLNYTLYGIDDILQTTATATLSATPGKNLAKKVNHRNEKCSLKLQVDGTGSKFNIKSVSLIGKPSLATRPL